MNKIDQTNPSSLAAFGYILWTVLFTVYGQIVLKWQIAKAGTLPASFFNRFVFLLGFVFNPWILTGIAAGFLAFLCWMAALTRFELSYAYPFMSASFVLVLIFSVILFHEPVTLPKIAGLSLVIAGLVIASRG